MMASGQSFSLERAVVQNQRKAREIICQVNSTSAPNSAASVEICNTQINLSDSTTADGTFPFTFDKPFYRTPIIHCVDDGTGFHDRVIGKSNLGFTVLNLRDAGTIEDFNLQDSDFSCIIKGWDAEER